MAKRTYTISKEKIGEREAVIQINSLPGVMEQKVVTLLNDGIYYSIALNATTKKGFKNNNKAFEKLLETFVVLERSRKFSDNEIQTSMVASKKRLAELFESMGQVEEALEYLKEGLAIDPDNKDLKEMEERLRSR